MMIMHKGDGHRARNGESCQVTEYGFAGEALGAAMVEVGGRYPEQGFAINHECMELVYVLEGEGRIVTAREGAGFASGDVISIGREEKYFWEGRFTALICSAPAWYPAQYEQTK